MSMVLQIIYIVGCSLVERAGKKYNKLRAKQEQHIAWNNTTVDLIDASEVIVVCHIRYTKIINEAGQGGLKHV